MDSLMLASYLLKNQAGQRTPADPQTLGRSGRKELLSVVTSFAVIGLATLALDFIAR